MSFILTLFSDVDLHLSIDNTWFNRNREDWLLNSQSTGQMVQSSLRTAVSTPRKLLLLVQRIGLSARRITYIFWFGCTGRNKNRFSVSTQMWNGNGNLNYSLTINISLLPLGSLMVGRISGEALRRRKTLGPFSGRGRSVTTSVPFRHRFCWIQQSTYQRND